MPLGRGCIFCTADYLQLLESCFLWKGIHAFRVDCWMKREISRSIKQSSSNDPHLYERRQHYSISSHMELAGKEEPQRKCSYWSADCYQVKLASQQNLTRLFKMHWLSPSPTPPPRNLARARLLKFDFHWAQRAFTLSAMNVKLFTCIIPGSEAQSTGGTTKRNMFASLQNFKVDFFFSLLTFIRIILFHH